MIIRGCGLQAGTYIGVLEGCQTRSDGGRSRLTVTFALEALFWIYGMTPCRESFDLVFDIPSEEFSALLNASRRKGVLTPLGIDPTALNGAKVLLVLEWINDSRDLPVPRLAWIGSALMMPVRLFKRFAAPPRALPGSGR